MPKIDKSSNERAERTSLDHRDFDLFNFSPVPMWVYDTHSLQILAANDAAQKDYGYTLAEFLCLNVKQLWLEEDFPIMMKLLEERVKEGFHIKDIVRHIKKDGEIIYAEVASKPVPSWGEDGRIVIAVDITSSKRLHDLESHEKKVLALNSKSEVPLAEVLAYYVNGIESLFPQMHCTIMQVKHNRIYKWVATSLPKAYTDEIEGLEIGVNAGSCGTAAFLKQTVIVSDITTDSRWTDYQQMARSFNLSACWSQPIVNSAGEVMATFAIYYNKVKEPNEDELKVIERASSILKVILENRQYAEILQESNSMIKEHLDRMEQHNLRLLDIAWAQTHLVRAPLARILGLIELLQDAKGKPLDEQLLDYLSISAKELDDVIKDIINKSLNDRSEMDKLITFTRIFSDCHIRKGEPTYFVEALLNNFMSQNIKCNVAQVEARLGLKLLPEFQTTCRSKGHTIRSGNDWKVGDKFIIGIWLDKPHLSKIATIDTNIEVKKVWKFECDENGVIKVDGFCINKEQKAEIARNDGLSLIDFENWIVTPCRTTKKPFKGQIICWDESISYELSKFERQS